MESNATPSSEVNTQPDEIWRRFTLLDLMILITGHGAAMGALKWQEVFEHLRNWVGFDNSWYGAAVLTSWYCITVLLLGAVFSLPLIFTVQFFFRERHEKIARGEIVAAILVGYWSIIFLYMWLHLNGGWAGLILFIFSFLAALSILVEILMLLGELFLKRKLAPCPWISYYGYFLGVISILEFAPILICYRG
jgi:hypothetical protein